MLDGLCFLIWLTLRKADEYQDTPLFNRNNGPMLFPLISTYIFQWYAREISWHVDGDGGKKLKSRSNH